MNQQELNKYFSEEWTDDFDNYTLSGYELAYKCKRTDWVLDVGCGHNPFKGQIKNLVGIDPANNKADIVTTLEDFEHDKLFDVAFCLGSLNFGSKQKIRKQIKKLLTHMQPKCQIHWRCNPGRHDHGKPSTHKVPFFEWSQEVMEEFAKEFGFSITEQGAETPEPNKYRLYFEWTR